MVHARRVARRAGPWIAAVGGLLVAVSVVRADYLGLFVGPYLLLYIGGTTLLSAGGFLIGRRFFGRLLLLLGCFNGIIAGIDREAPKYAWSYFTVCVAALAVGSFVLWWNSRAERHNENRTG